LEKIKTDSNFTFLVKYVQVVCVSSNLLIQFLTEVNLISSLSPGITTRWIEGPILFSVNEAKVIIEIVNAILESK
jgi:hypothetical protein